MKRSFGIDLVRAGSILLVMLRHYGFTPGFNVGYYAIEYLFVISGFLIGQILFNDFYSSENIERASLKRFMIRRWFRILPLYYFAILVKFAIHPDIGWNILYYIFFLQNHFFGIQFYPETWTLVIDEWFYLLIPIMLFLFMRFVSMKDSAVAWFIVAIIVVVSLGRTYWVYKTGVQWEGLTGNVVFRQDTLLMGVLLAFVKKKYYHIFQKLTVQRFFIVAAALVVGYIFMMYIVRTPQDTINQHVWTRTINFTLCSLLIAMTLPYIEGSVDFIKPKRLAFLNTLVVWGSKLSYALYLAHSEVLRLLNYFLSPMAISAAAIGILAIFVTVIVSYLLYQFVEKKFLIIRDRYYPDRPFA